MTTDTSAREIVFIDSRVQDVATLLKGMSPGAEVVVLNAGEDGLQQMAAVLGERGDVGAVHVLAHGSEGQLLLGNTVLGNQLDSHSAQLASIGRAMTQDGDLLVYACDVGAGEEGAQFVSTLAQLTGADVAASTDLTGAAALGGNWALEAHEGKIDTKTLEITDYQDVFTLISLNGSDADYSSTTIVKQVTGQNITFSGGASAGGLGIDGTYGTDGLYAYQGPTNEVRLTITAAAGYSFDINSFDVGVMTGSLKIDFTYADGTTDTLTVNSLAGSWQTLSNTGLSKPINDVKQVVFSSSEFGLFQNFDITDVKLLPPTAKVNGASLSTDSGSGAVGTSSDFITNVASQTISGTLSANLASGERVQVSYDNGSNWADATTYAVGSSNWSTTTTLAGSNTFIARVSNATGSSTAYSHTYQFDDTAPTISFSGYALSSDTGIPGDLITKTTSQTITATLSGAPAGTDVVWGSTDNGNSWTDVTSKVSGTTLTWTGATLDATNQTLRFKVTDAAGNDSAASVQAYTLDTTVPTTTIASVAFSNDSGTPGDFITNMASQTVSGTLSADLVAGETVLVSLDNGGTWATATAAVGTSTWSLGRTLTASNTLMVVVSDTAGNFGSIKTQAYVYDTTPPGTTFSGLALSVDSGTPGDFVTNTAAQTFSATLSGALSAGDVLYGSVDNGAHWADITSKVSGTTLTWNGVTLSGSDTLRLKVTDAAGNDGTVRTQIYVLDTTLPAAPSTPVLASASDSGASNSDGITSDNTPTFTGTGEDGSTVSIYDGATLLGIATVVAGNWSFTAGALSNASHTITAVATDTAGNPSAPSAGLTITVDTAAPTVVSVAVPTNGTYYSGGTLDFTVNFNEVVTVDTMGGMPSIAITVGGATRQAVYMTGSDSSALLFRYTVVNGDTDADGITVGVLSLNSGTIKDVAGNNAMTTLNAVGVTTGVNVDGTNPSITGVSASTADGAYGADATVTITVDFSTGVDVDTTHGTPTLALSSGGVATYTGGSGSGTLTFSYTVGAGENSADLDVSSTAALVLHGATIIDAGGSHQAADVTLATPGTAGSLGANKDIVIDTAAPTNTVDGAAFSADTGSSGSDFITKTAAQTVSGTLAANLAAGEHVYVSLDNGGSWVLAAASTGTNTWSLAGQTLTGSDTLKVRVSDDAGNNGSAFEQAYVLDTTSPTISFSGVALSADTGTSNTDLITKTAAQTISATLSSAPAAGDVVNGSLDNGASWTDITSMVSGTTLTWTGVTLAASNTLQLRVTDAAGNNGGATDAAYVLDTTGPGTSVATVAFSADSGASSTDFITKTAAQTVSGTLSANLGADERVLVSLDNGATWSAATAAVGASAWSLSGQTLSASDTLLVKVVDEAGNDGTVLPQAYVYDTAATVPSVDPLSSMSLTPVLTGAATLAAGETMTVTVGGATYDVVPVAGAWSLNLAAAVPTSGTLTLVLNHRYEVVATVTDLAGNVASDTTASELLLGTLPVIPEPEPPVTPPTPNPPTPGVPDNDGIPAIIEDQTPGIPGPGGTTPVPGDGNGDGIKDSEQASVASIGFVFSPTGESNPGSAPPTYTTLVASSQDGKVSGDPSNSRITSLSQKDAPPDLPHGLETPIGLVSFTVELAQGKTGENFSLYVDPALGVNGYWKEDSTGTWINIASEPYGGKMVMEGGRLRLDFHIEDGGQFDADGKVDGIITDPGAPGHMPLSIVGQTPDVGHGFWF